MYITWIESYDGRHSHKKHGHSAQYAVQCCQGNILTVHSVLNNVHCVLNNAHCVCKQCTICTLYFNYYKF